MMSTPQSSAHHTIWRMIIDALIKDGWKATNGEAAAESSSSSSSLSSSVTLPPFTPSGLSELRLERRSRGDNEAIMLQLHVRAVMLSDNLIIHARLHTSQNQEQMLSATKAGDTATTTAASATFPTEPSVRIAPLCIQHVSKLTQQQQHMPASSLPSSVAISSIQHQVNEWVEKMNAAVRSFIHSSNAHRLLAHFMEAEVQAFQATVATPVVVAPSSNHWCSFPSESNPTPISCLVTLILLMLKYEGFIHLHQSSQVSGRTEKMERKNNEESVKKDTAPTYSESDRSTSTSTATTNIPSHSPFPSSWPAFTSTQSSYSFALQHQSLLRLMPDHEVRVKLLPMLMSGQVILHATLHAGVKSETPVQSSQEAMHQQSTQRNAASIAEEKGTEMEISEPAPTIYTLNLRSE